MRRLGRMGLILAFILMAAAACQAQPATRSLQPRLPTPTAAGIVLQHQTTPLTFAEIEADPATYRGRLIQVTGAFARNEPVPCANYKGPRLAWGLVNDGRQMDALGLVQLVEILDIGTPITVEGIWRVYDGPVGCGKEPSRQVVWYLQAQRIVAPNPLTAGDSAAVVPGAVDAVGGDLAPAALPEDNEPVVTPTPLVDGTPASEAGAEPTESVTASAISPPSPTPLFQLPTATDDAEPTPRPGRTPTATPTVTPTNGAASPTPEPGEGAGATATPTMTATPTPIPDDPATPTPLPPLPTSTPRPAPTGYPEPTQPPAYP